jgi:hypothetical protein
VQVLHFYAWDKLLFVFSWSSNNSSGERKDGKEWMRKKEEGIEERDRRG